MLVYTSDSIEKAASAVNTRVTMSVPGREDETMKKGIVSGSVRISHCTGERLNIMVGVSSQVEA